MVNPIHLNVEVGQAYSGLGDLVTLAWLAEGCRGTTCPIVVHRSRDRDLMAMLGLDFDPEPGGLSLAPVYAHELADRGRRPRVDYLAEFLGLSTPLLRPMLRIAPEIETWAEDRLAELGRPLVLLFPQTAWRTREWPACYWVDLAWKLKSVSIATVILMNPKDDRYTNTPNHWWGLTHEQTGALIKRASLVVGNDSYPAHVAGILGVSTLALMGPTRPTVFAHASTVRTLSSSLDCTGCHFGSPFRAACDQGCQSLYQLDPDRVVEVILSGGPERAGHV